jgi:hypothetical protein
MGFNCHKRSSLDEKNVDSSDTTLHGSQSREAETLLSSVSCRVCRQNASLAGAMHSALMRNETRSLRNVQR